MLTSAGRNRRQEPRIRWWSGCEVTGLKIAGLRAYTVDVSYNGLGLVGKVPFLNRSTLRVALATFPSAGSLSVTGTVVWLREYGDFSLVGLELDQSSRKQMAWLNHVSSAEAMNQVFERHAVR